MGIADEEIVHYEGEGSGVGVVAEEHGSGGFGEPKGAKSVNPKISRNTPFHLFFRFVTYFYYLTRNTLVINRVIMDNGQNFEYSCCYSLR